MRVLAIGLVMVLAGCAGGGVAGFAPAVVGGGAGLPETPAAARGGEVVPPGRRSLGLAVRSYAHDAAGSLAEVAGARCAVTAGALRADLVTPARLILPDLGPDAPAVRADCTRGALRGAGTAPPAYAWAATGGNPVERALWGGGWWYGGVRSGPMRYPDLAIGLR